MLLRAEQRGTAHRLGERVQTAIRVDQRDEAIHDQTVEAPIQLARVDVLERRPPQYVQRAIGVAKKRQDAAAHLPVGAVPRLRSAGRLRKSG